MLILIHLCPINGKASYPSGVSSVREQVAFNGTDYWIAEAVDDTHQTGPDTYAEYSAGIDVFTTGGEVVTINGNPAAGFQSVYFGVSGDSANMTFNIVDDQGALQSQIDSASLGYPPILALPVMKVANGSGDNIVDEVYFSTTIESGVVTVAGSFPASGNWKLLTERINAGLAEIGAHWAIEKDDVTFRINS